MSVINVAMLKLHIKMNNVNGNANIVVVKKMGKSRPEEKNATNWILFVAS